MPLPLVVMIGLGIAAMFAGTVSYLKWDEIVLALKGKRVAVLGARGVGKTHLVTFLTTGSIPPTYKQTVTPAKVPARRFDLKELELNVKDSLDVAGDKVAYAKWKELVAGSDVVLYLLRADKVLKGDAAVEARVRQDIKHIGEWLDGLKERPEFFIIGTHCDLAEGFPELAEDQIGDYVDKFTKLPIMSELFLRVGGASRVKVVIGSMKTIDHTEALVYDTFAQVAS